MEEIFAKWVRAHQQADRETLEELTAEEFVFEQAGFDEPLDKESYLTLVDALHRAFPDLDVDAEPANVEDGLVESELRLAATHEQDLDLTRLGLDFYRSTGNAIDVAAEAARTRIQEGRVREHAIEDPEAGIAGIIGQIREGVERMREEARQHEPRAPGA